MTDNNAVRYEVVNVRTGERFGDHTKEQAITRAQVMNSHGSASEYAPVLRSFLRRREHFEVQEKQQDR
jgi:hypothetical protein